METRQLTYDLNPDDPSPLKGQYLVSIGNKGIGSVYLIRAVRIVKQKIVREYVRYCLTVLPQPELKAYTEFVLRYRGAQVWVRGVEALPCFWNPRKKKIQLHDRRRF